jgi:formylmethanofuran dehydrogenase subunit D
MRCVFIAGRTIEQGQQEILGKHRDEYRAVVSTLQMNAEDLAQLGISPGMSVRARSEWGEAVFQTVEGDLPPGIAFVPYGPPTSQMMGGETLGTGMPNSRGWDVEIEPVTTQAPDGQPEA